MGAVLGDRLDYVLTGDSLSVWEVVRLLDTDGTGRVQIWGHAHMGGASVPQLGLEVVDPPEESDTDYGEEDSEAGEANNEDGV